MHWLHYNSSTYIIHCLDGIPNDGVPIEDVVTVSLGITVVYTILAVVGIVFAIGCLLFNLVFRQRV